MSTFQVRASGAVVRNIPKQFDENSPFFISFTDQDLSISFLIKGTTCYIPLQTPTETEVKSPPRFNRTSPDGTWDPSSSEFEVSNPDLFNSNLSQYSDSKPNQNLYSIQSHPVVEDEFLSSINAAFYLQAFISALECNVLVRPQGIGGMRVVALLSTTRKSSITPKILSKS